MTVDSHQHPGFVRPRCCQWRPKQQFALWNLLGTSGGRCWWGEISLLLRLEAILHRSSSVPRLKRSSVHSQRLFAGWQSTLWSSSPYPNNYLQPLPWIERDRSLRNAISHTLVVWISLSSVTAHCWTHLTWLSGWSLHRWRTNYWAHLVGLLTGRKQNSNEVVIRPFRSTSSSFSSFGLLFSSDLPFH